MVLMVLMAIIKPSGLDFEPEWMDLLSEEEQSRLAICLNMLIGGESFAEFICRVDPEEPPPMHVMPIIDVMEQARLRPIRVAIDMGPGHAKTKTLLRGIAWWLSKSPADLCAYVTYSDGQAREKSRISKEAFERSGGKLGDGGDGNWHTPQGGGLIAKGSKGGLTGKRIPGLLVYDDPYKDAQEARSPAVNSMVIERFKGVAFTRLQGGSIIVLHTRWAMDDLIGYILKNLKWDHISIPTVCDEVGRSAGGSGTEKSGVDRFGRHLGEVAWPEKYPYDLCLEPDKRSAIQVKTDASKGVIPKPVRKICGHDGHLVEIRKTIGEHMWAALYQGKPRPEGHAIFHEPARYDLKTFDWTGKRGVISIDPAATAKTSADYSAIAVLAMEGYGLDARMWLVNMIRLQVEIPELVSRARRLQLQTRLLVGIEAVSGFKGVGQALRAIAARDEHGRPLGTMRVLDVIPGSRDKFTRAQPVAAAWNDSRFLLPMTEGCDWVDPLIERFQRFTGVGGGEDDEVDAVSQGWNLLYRERGRERMSQREDGM
jgi:predicted phage terminase large subunit-like protein